jgi:UDP-N-acetylmuramoylalanine--D-glutamate ligase
MVGVDHLTWQPDLLRPSLDDLAAPGRSPERGKGPNVFTNHLVTTNGNVAGSPLGAPDIDLLRAHFAGRKIVVLGLARQGMALTRFFAGLGAQVVVSDAAPAERLTSETTALNGIPIAYVLGSHPLSLLDDCALLCLSGGVPAQLPIVAAAIARGISLSNDGLLTCQLAAGHGLSPLVAITGSSGKTTTTTLVGKFLAADGRTVHVGGNIGQPLLDRLSTLTPGPTVLELSSFQLELFDSALAWGSLHGSGPQVACITNLTPNHLDRHPSMADYAAAKFNLLKQMEPGSTLVVNLDDPVIARLAPPELLPKRKKLPPEWRLDDLLEEMQAMLHDRGVRIVPVSQQIELTTGAWLERGVLTLDGRPICHRSEVLLRGDHNIGNLLTACAIAQTAGADVDHMGDVARTFAGVPHRLEVVAQDHQVTWINDSIATSPERAIAALRSFEPGKQTLILLAGGKDKNLPWDTFANEALARVSFLIGFGQSGPMIVNLVQERARFSQQKAPNCAVVQRLDEAVELAARVAGPNSVVLLSPGGTSYDAYRDFEQRGEHFRQLVRRMIDTNVCNGSRSKAIL